MSAMNVFVAGDACHIFTDGAIYDAQTAVIQGFMSKVAALPQYPAALAVTGAPACRMLLEGMVAEIAASGFDQLAGVFAAEAQLRYSAQPQYLANGRFEIILAGWSARDHAPAAYFMQGHSSNGKPAFELRKVRKFLSPYDGAFVNIELKAGDDPAKLGLEILTEQRRRKFSPLGSNAVVHAVGGFAQHTIVKRDGVSMTKLHQWGDEIGTRIEP